MSNNSLSIESFRDTARAALYEAELNAIRDRHNTEMQDKLWAQFDILERIVVESNAAAREFEEGE